MVVVHPLWRPYDDRANAARQIERVAYRQMEPGPLSARHSDWDAEYTALHRTLLSAIPDQVLRISHVGSTAIPGLVAKPVLDIDLVVPDVENERAYVPSLEAVGFRLTFRDEIGGDAHRQLTLAMPNTNLHIWGVEALEPQRHELFRTWLRTHEGDRDRYAAAKHAAAAGDGRLRYNDAKSAIIYDIYERAFLADPAHDHDPQPRARSG